MRANAAARLAQHYVDNYRVLPWRSPPGSAVPPDPYRVWLSEVMLQQTTVATVRPRFQRFVERWPTIADLAAADEADVLGEWAGLGYYARARNLIACARAVSAQGGFPRTAAALRLLPGIGAYTSAAIAAIAFGEKAPAVDTNIARVLARVHGLAEPTPKMLEAAMAEWLAHGHAGDMVQALMDLGATLCTPRRPACALCPLNRDCRAFAVGAPEDFPRPKAKKPRPHRVGAAHWIERDGAIWLVRRPARGLLGGMAALPGDDWRGAERPDAPALAEVRHVFTHFSLDLVVVAGDAPSGEGWWQPLDRIEEAGLPTLYRRAVETVLASRVPSGQPRLEVSQCAP